MAEEERTREVVIEVLKEQGLHNFINIFENEHNVFRGTHESISARAIIQNEEPERPYAGLIWVDLSS